MYGSGRTTGSVRGYVRSVGARRTGEDGLSLVGMLVVLALLGALTVLAVSSLGGDDDLIGAARPGSRLHPAAGAAGAGPGGGTGEGAAGLVGASSVAACQADVAAIESAMTAARAVLGRFPATVAELVTSGFLSEVPHRAGFAFSVEMVNGSATGRVLVNGRPAEESCTSPVK